MDSKLRQRRKVGALCLLLWEKQQATCIADNGHRLLSQSADPVAGGCEEGWAQPLQLPEIGPPPHTPSYKSSALPRNQRALPKMDLIQHHFVQVSGGPKLHIAEAGTGSTVVVFLHGFPEIWYTWRHQMVAAANAGYRAVAPDLRGYGLSDPSPNPATTSYHDLERDLLTILDEYLGISKVFLVAKDYGSIFAHSFTLVHPERVLGIVTVGIPYLPPGTTRGYDEKLPEGFYISRWRQPGRAEADFGRFEAKRVVRNVYILFSRSEIPIAEENQEIMDLVEPSTPLPPWMTEEDMDAYGALYDKSGFQTALQVPYRSLEVDLDVTDPILRAPELLIMGVKDYVCKFPGIKELIASGKMKEFVPDLEMVFLPEGGHFANEQLPDEVNKLLLSFLRDRSKIA